MTVTHLWIHNFLNTIDNESSMEKVLPLHETMVIHLQIITDNSYQIADHQPETYFQILAFKMLKIADNFARILKNLFLFQNVKRYTCLRWTPKGTQLNQTEYRGNLVLAGKKRVACNCFLYWLEKKTQHNKSRVVCMSALLIVYRLMGVY